MLKLQSCETSKYPVVALIASHFYICHENNGTAI